MEPYCWNGCRCNVPVDAAPPAHSSTSSIYVRLVAKLVVPGGNGFIGTEICRIAVQHGHDVAAFGRTGRPALTPARHPWIEEVDWRAANVIAPDTWRDLLPDADAVIYLIGTLQERPAQGVTFKRLLTEAALRVAAEADRAGVGSYVYLSAQDKPPLIDDDFLTAKREAERRLSDEYSGLRTVSLRPNLVYGPQRPGSATLAAMLAQLHGVKSSGYGSFAGRSLPVELVAAAAVQAATTDTLEGPLGVPQIEDLGRTSGLVNLDEVTEPSITPLLAGVGGTVLGAWLLRKWLS